jgi:hypothetical protein
MNEKLSLTPLVASILVGIVLALIVAWATW